MQKLLDILVLLIHLVCNLENLWWNVEFSQYISHEGNLGNLLYLILCLTFLCIPLSVIFLKQLTTSLQMLFLLCSLCGEHG